MTRILLACLSGYQRISHWLRAAQVPGVVYTPCRFYPSCSEYAELAIKEFGPVKGTLKSLKRISRCHPFAAGGVDYPA